MKLLLFFLAAISSFSLFGQEILKHEKRLYVSPEGKYYINQRLPVYISLATSDAPNAKQHLLKSEKTPQFVNPINFSTDGHKPIRVASTPNRVPIYLDLHVDGEPPLATTKIEGAKDFGAAGTKIYGKGLKITFSAKDDISGVENIYVSVNKAAYKANKEPLTFSKDGDYEIKYYSTDNVGNIEAPKILSFKVDMTPPETTYKFEGPKSGDILSDESKIILEKKDNMSGTFKSMYAFDGGEFRNYTGTISCKPLKDGKHDLVFYTIDNVGNAEDEKKASNKYSFYLDRTAPDLDIKIDGVKFKSQGNTLFINGDTKIVLENKDNHSGVDKVTYEIKSADPQISIKSLPTTDYTASFTLKEKGPQVIIAEAVDKLGNKKKKSLKVYMDNVPPKTGIKYARPQFFNSETSILCITSKTFITFFTTMYHSGVKKTTYKIDEGKEVEYNGPFQIPTEGKHKITRRSIDNVENSEPPLKSFVMVDNTPPTVSIRFPTSGKNINMAGKTYTAYPPKSRMYLDVKDNISGVKSIYFQVNGGSKLDYNEISSAVMEELFMEPIVYKVVVTVTDKLNNTAVKVFEFAVVKD